MIVHFNEDGYKVGIPLEKITGFSQSQDSCNPHLTFVATGPDGDDGGENGWYVDETYEEVTRKLEEAKDADK